MEILFVEDDEMIASGIIYSLESEGFLVFHAGNQQKALELIHSKIFSLAILDLSLPDGNGFFIFNKIKQKYDIPIIFLTAADDEGNTVKGLDMGADDYIAKPFRLRELIARIKSVMRRSANNSDTLRNIDTIRIKDIEIRPSQGKVLKDDEEIMLTALEYKLLMTFTSNRGHTLTRDQLLNALWDNDGNFVNDNTLTVYIKRLREKIGDNEIDPTIQTIRGIGYRMD